MWWLAPLCWNPAADEVAWHHPVSEGIQGVGDHDPTRIRTHLAGYVGRLGAPSPPSAGGTPAAGGPR